jgi:hypothetical protein
VTKPEYVAKLREASLDFLLATARMDAARNSGANAIDISTVLQAQVFASRYLHEMLKIDYARLEDVT